MYVPVFRDASGYREAVWQILIECDDDFLPALSARSGTYERGGASLSDIPHDSCAAEGPRAYFKDLEDQGLLVALLDSRAIGFLSFISGFERPELASCSPSIYMTTGCVTGEYRSRGIMAHLVSYLIDEICSGVEYRFVTTRTWSTNTASINHLESLGFLVVRTVRNNRGKGIDTLYYAREIG